MAVEIKVPTLGESIVEATVGKWRKREGEPVAAGEPLVDLETDKVNVEVTAEQSGVLERILKGEGTNVTIGETLGLLAAGDGAAAKVPPTERAASPEAAVPSSAPAPPAPSAASSAPAPLPATPVARRVAAAEGVDLSGVPGSGPGGRITKGDVVAASAARDDRPATKDQRSAAPPTTPGVPSPPAPAPAPPPSPVVGPSSGRREERVRMTRRRQTIAARLVEAQRTAAMLTTFNEVDMTAVMELRKRRRDSFKERHGVGLGFMSFFTRAVVGALKAFPLVNAEIQGDEIVIKHYYDIGIAVSTDEGLVVPVLRDADRLSFAGIERGIEELARKAREGKLTIADLQGGTFTITNGGIFGSLMSTPILNTPQVGILGMHAIKERPVVVGGQIVARPMMYLAFSYDHRIIDGREAVSFLVRVKELVEDPETLLLEG
ncbi:MAG TPA: 2-oxoglutarate dehydrogenase complex dihydrolipoyllysine-residue succinyltransferase [Roseiflexaceae bacterium]|nr:2-oxoglutarate dehydrogenase complex dihydrolipoyllysine-residue succinyltransferase [Roseiflexaceae bacterium]